MKNYQKFTNSLNTAPEFFKNELDRFLTKNKKNKNYTVVNAFVDLYNECIQFPQLFKKNYNVIFDILISIGYVIPVKADRLVVALRTFIKHKGKYYMVNNKYGSFWQCIEN